MNLEGDYSMWPGCICLGKPTAEAAHHYPLCSCELFCYCYFQVLAQHIHCNISMTAAHSTVNSNVIQGTEGTVEAERQW